ncbi:SURF1 family protein [soil metagenome]
MRRRRIWPVLLAGGVGCACLVILGLWQIERLHWKEGLIAAREARLSAPPVTLDAAMRQADSGAPIEFLKIAASGSFRHERELFYLTTAGGSPGFEVVTPLIAEDGTAVLVDRGFVPEDKRDPLRRPESQPAGPVTVQGFAAAHAYGRGYFTPDNNAGDNVWYWWDVPAMLDMSGVPPGSRAAPFILHELPRGDASLPQPTPPDASLPNNHLQYAITWLSLALILAIMTGLFIRQQMRERDT